MGWDFQVYYSEETHLVPVEVIEGKCEVMKKHDLPPCDVLAIFEHVFFCERLYDPSKGSLKLVLLCLLTWMIDFYYLISSILSLECFSVLEPDVLPIPFVDSCQQTLN